jgi:hypothetical protein
MKHTKTIFFLFALQFLFAFCGSKEGFQQKFPQEISAISFEKWMAGRKETGSGTTIRIEFKKPLSKIIHLEKIYFQGFETQIERENETTFKASFYFNAIYRNPNSSNFDSKKFILKQNEAVIEYQKNNKTFFYKCRNIKEIPMIAYP